MPDRVAWALLALILVAVAAVRWRLLDVPLERDEGEYAYAGQLMLEGVPPYQLAYNMKLPGIYAAYAAILAVFGQTTRGIHLGFLVVNAAAIALVFLLARRLFDRVTGVFAALAYAVMSASPTVLGAFAHATHFVVVPALGGALLLHRAGRRGGLPTIFFGGLLFGLAFLMKQQGVFFVAFGGVVVIALIVRQRPPAGRAAARLGVFAAGAALPLLVTSAILAAAGTFDRFWFWTVAYASEYVSAATLGDGVANLRESGGTIVTWNVAICLLALGGLAVVAFDARARSARGFLFAFALFSFLTVCPGLYFRPHYFITFLPVVAILAGVAARAAGSALTGRRETTGAALAGCAVVAIAAGQAAWSAREFLFRASPVRVARMCYGRNPFPEAVEIARYIEAHTTPDETIAVLGSEPEIYFYSHRRSATGHIYVYALVENQAYAATMQDEMIREITAARPRYVVLVKIATSWCIQPGADTGILAWAEHELAARFDLVGAADILDHETTLMRWDDDVRDFEPRSDASVLVFRRRGP